MGGEMGAAAMKRQGKLMEMVDLPRLVELDRMLARDKGVTVAELAQRFQVSTKTAYRDIELCKLLYGRRLSFTEERHNRRRYRIDGADRLFATWVRSRTQRLK
jgi:hypothetical protein